MIKLATLLFGLLTFAAQAHFPLLNCQLTAQQQQLSCVAGYSDGSLAGKVTLNVFNYDEEPLLSINTASDGSITFTPPKGEYYIVFDPGHESPAEFDYAELN
ncbi:hypothetical protein GCM10009111_06700 [Colwellia asteriadis]|uniref:Carboxypeptidase regulatory-like domain-containing protein n=1 Tax=Colwellia asteriadis TaxID=517723 RepID=A0ABN1L3S5_9GAMM